MRRRGYLLGGGAFLAVAAAVAVLLAVVLGDGGEPELTRAEYIARVDAVCREYNRRLAAIPAPLAVGNTQAVAASIDRALPLLVERAQRAKDLERPPELEDEMEHVFERSDQAILYLRGALRQARAGDLADTARALGSFVATSGQAQAAARRIGLDC